jgi:hypothetical protein
MTIPPQVRPPGLFNASENRTRAKLGVGKDSGQELMDSCAEYSRNAGDRASEERSGLFPAFTILQFGKRPERADVHVAFSSA